MNLAPQKLCAPSLFRGAASWTITNRSLLWTVRTRLCSAFNVIPRVREKACLRFEVLTRDYQIPISYLHASRGSRDSMQRAILLERLGRHIDRAFGQIVSRGKVSRESQHENEREMHAPDDQYKFQIGFHDSSG